MFDGIEFRGFSQDHVEILGEHAGVPSEWFNRQMASNSDVSRLYDGERRIRYITRQETVYTGDGRNNIANSANYRCNPWCRHNSCITKRIIPGKIID